MQPTVPVACMVPRRPPMGNTQAKLAAFNNVDDTRSRSPATTAQYQKQYTTSARDRRDALKSPARRFSEPAPRPKSGPRRPQLHSGKRAAVDNGHEEPLKKRRQVQMQTVRCHFLMNVPRLTRMQRIHKASPRQPVRRVLDNNRVFKVVRQPCYHCLPMS